MQETRKNFESTPSYNYINKLRETNTHGGGIAIGIQKDFFFRDLSTLIPSSLHENAEMLLI